MLVLSRKSGQSIRIGTDVAIEVISIHKRRVKLGLKCPRQVPIRRGELVDTANLATYVDVPCHNGRAPTAFDRHLGADQR
jgi:carbon storage regulator CsrA